MATIPLRGRTGEVVAEALIDDENAAALRDRPWRLDRDGYAVAWGRNPAGRTTTIRMNRVILGLAVGDPRIGDHINRNRLDNRRANLRILTVAQSAQHRGPRARSRSRFRGVNYVPHTGRWIARVRLGSPGKLHNLGTYDAEEEAARVAAAFRAQHMPFSVEEVTA